jgi:tetratricopeptide (TPR) repeat protein
VPQTLPSHTSMMTGLYPGGHGIHENARPLDEQHALVAERLKAAGYPTAAFISAFALARRFGLARGFDVYDEPEKPERPAKETTDRALAWLAAQPQQPLFVWVHYYDPHYPYTPPEPYRTRYAKQPYLGEVASMDEQLGRLIAAFEKKGAAAILVLADHGEGLGDHGEQQHGNLLYQSTMHVPLVISGPGVTAGTSDEPVPTRRVFHTILDWAGIDATNSLRKPASEVVMGEAMKPFLDYGWQPQVMAVEGNRKTILAGRTEVYDVVADPGETHDLAASASLSRPVRAALRDYPLPSPQPPAEALDDEGRRKLASLGYVASTVKPVVRADAPRPADMTSLYPILDEAAALFVAGRYAACIPLLERILAKDPMNLDAALRLATAHSSLGHDVEALQTFRRAEAIAPDNADVRTYLALHLARGKDWARAVPMLERVLAETPDKVPALEALAVVRERQGRIDDALAVRQKLYALRAPSAPELVALGSLAMQAGHTALGIDAFEHARAMQGSAFRNDLELGVLLLASGRYAEARDALDRVPRSHPGYAMALFKRAQVSVLLREPDAQLRIAAARAGADDVTRELIAHEGLFRQ